MLPCICLHTLHSFGHSGNFIIERNPAVPVTVCYKFNKTVSVDFFLRLIDILGYIGIIAGTYLTIFAFSSAIVVLLAAANSRRNKNALTICFIPVIIC